MTDADAGSVDPRSIPEMSLDELYHEWVGELLKPTEQIDTALIASIERRAQRAGVDFTEVIRHRGLLAADWNPDLHPRGHDGKFIEIMGWVNVLTDTFTNHGKGTNKPDFQPNGKREMRGQVTGIIPDPKNPGKPDIRVTIRDKDGNLQQVVTVKPNNVSAAPDEKGRLPDEPHTGFGEGDNLPVDANDPSLPENGPNEGQVTEAPTAGKRTESPLNMNDSTTIGNYSYDDNTVPQTTPDDFMANIDRHGDKFSWSGTDKNGRDVEVDGYNAVAGTNENDSSPGHVTITVDGKEYFSGTTEGDFAGDPEGFTAEKLAELDDGGAPDGNSDGALVDMTPKTSDGWTPGQDESGLGRQTFDSADGALRIQENSKGDWAVLRNDDGPKKHGGRSSIGSGATQEEAQAAADGYRSKYMDPAKAMSDDELANFNDLNQPSPLVNEVIIEKERRNAGGAPDTPAAVAPDLQAGWSTPAHHDLGSGLSMDEESHAQIGNLKLAVSRQKSGAGEFYYASVANQNSNLAVKHFPVESSSADEAKAWAESEANKLDPETGFKKPEFDQTRVRSSNPEPDAGGTNYPAFFTGMSDDELGKQMSESFSRPDSPKETEFRAALMDEMKKRNQESGLSNSLSGLTPDSANDYTGPTVPAPDAASSSNFGDLAWDPNGNQWVHYDGSAASSDEVSAIGQDPGLRDAPPDGAPIFEGVGGLPDGIKNDIASKPELGQSPGKGDGPGPKPVAPDAAPSGPPRDFLKPAMTSKQADEHLAGLSPADKVKTLDHNAKLNDSRNKKAALSPRIKAMSDEHLKAAHAEAQKNGQHDDVKTGLKMEMARRKLLTKDDVGGSGGTSPAAVAGVPQYKAGDKAPIQHLPPGSLVRMGGKDRKVGSMMLIDGGDPNNPDDYRGRVWDGQQWDYVQPQTQFQVVQQSDKLPSGAQKKLLALGGADVNPDAPTEGVPSAPKASKSSTPTAPSAPSVDLAEKAKAIDPRKPLTSADLDGLENAPVPTSINNNDDARAFMLGVAARLRKAGLARNDSGLTGAELTGLTDAQGSTGFSLRPTGNPGEYDMHFDVSGAKHGLSQQDPNHPSGDPTMYSPNFGPLPAPVMKKINDALVGLPITAGEPKLTGGGGWDDDTSINIPITFTAPGT